MKIGLPSEIKPQGGRVALTPAVVHELVPDGHEVLVESRAGTASGYHDDAYRAQGAVVHHDAATFWGEAELIVKVKEPIAPEYGCFRDDLTLFTYLHLAPDAALTHALLDAGTRAIAYETVRDASGLGLPLLAPMSEVLR